jgi:signal transduction histidine kinase
MVDIITKQDTKLKELTKTLEKKIEQKTLENAKKDRLIIHQARLAELGEMIGNIAHQWRHPLTRLSLILQNIRAFSKKGILKEERLESMLKVANEQIFFMSETIDNFKDFYKPTNEEREFLIEDSYKRVINIVGYDLKHKNIEINFISEGDTKLFGDINQLSQVLLNLITNARDVLVENRVENPKIEVRVKEYDSSIKIVVSDNGGGIKEENLNRIFQPYFSTKSHGSGVGLYMVLTIIEGKFNGEVEVINSKDGASFEITIPKIDTKSSPR